MKWVGWRSCHRRTQNCLGQRENKKENARGGGREKEKMLFFSAQDGQTDTGTDRQTETARGKDSVRQCLQAPQQAK